ncbi:MAG: peptidoglycan DD-metalloendopeptidase family protein [Myxococcota bacterium]
MSTLRMTAFAAFGASLTVLLYTIHDIVTDVEETSDVVAEMHVSIAPPTAPMATPEPAPRGPMWVKHAIRSGESLGSILPRFNAPTHDVHQAALDLFDLSRIRVGRELSFLVTPGEDVPAEIRYPLDEDRTLVIHRTDDGWDASVDAIEYDVRIGERSLVVASTLWQAAIDAGLRPRDIASLAEVMKYDLDFNSEIKAGATARMVVEELHHDGALARLGAPLAVILTNNGKEYTAIRFKNDDGDERYYDRDGVSRRTAFLRSPLEFSRVTSGFNLKRYHPILKKPRPHYGTDFGAPVGTPIRAVGDGRIVHAGWNGGHGKYVKINHSAGPYKSSYSHLSRIAVKNGATVKQGEIIGYVGSTGMSTGPHLHYQFWKNGRIVDPMKVALPRGEQLSRGEMARFKVHRDALLTQLESVQGAPVPDALPDAEPPVEASLVADADEANDSSASD